MLPPLLRVMLDEPALFIEHASGYAKLVSEDARLWEARLRRRLALMLLVSGGLLLAAGLGGIALMLFATRHPAEADGVHWLLWAVPSLPLIVAVLAAGMLRREPDSPPLLIRLRAQLARDKVLLNPGEPDT